LNKGYWITNNWIEKFLYMKNYGSVSNFNYICVHGNIKPTYVDALEYIEAQNQDQDKEFQFKNTRTRLHSNGVIIS